MEAGARNCRAERQPIRGDGPVGHQLRVRLGAALVGERELQVHGEDEVVIIKPAARRFWMRSVGFEDADAVIAESFTGATA